LNTPLPGWFQADRVYSGRNGWHIGSPSGISVGPYANETEAQAASSTILAQLTRVNGREAQVSAIRDFINGQTAAIMEDDPAARVLTLRVGERSKYWVRSSRFFKVDEVWFFHTREGVDVGPYASESAVKADAALLVEILSTMHGEDEAARHMAIHQFMRTSFGCRQ